MQLARHLVTGDVFARVFLYLLEGQSRITARSRHCGDATAEARIRCCYYETIEDIGICLERLLHLFRKNLLAAGVDAVGSSAIHGNAVVFFTTCFITEQQPLLAVHGDNGFGSLYGIIVVTHRNVAAAREDTHCAALHVTVGFALDIADHRHELALDHVAQALAFLATAVEAHVAALGGAEGIGDEYIGETLAERLLLALGKHRTARTDAEHRAQVPAPGVRRERVQ